VRSKKETRDRLHDTSESGDAMLSSIWLWCLKPGTLTTLAYPALRSTAQANVNNHHQAVCCALAHYTQSHYLLYGFG